MHPRFLCGERRVGPQSRNAPQPAALSLLLQKLAPILPAGLLHLQGLHIIAHGQVWNELHPFADEATEDEEDEAGEDEEPSEDARSGNKVKLKPWNQRRGRSMGYEASGGRPIPLIDRIHRLMHLWKAGDVHKVDDYFDEHGLRRHELFRRVLQSLIELSKAGSEERALLESLSNHIGAKGAKMKGQQPTFAFGEEP